MVVSGGLIRDGVTGPGALDGGAGHLEAHQGRTETEAAFEKEESKAESDWSTKRPFR